MSVMRDDDEERVERALTRLSSLHPKLIDLGLERSLRLLEKLGNPHLRVPPVLHVAGTNGKGSVLAILRSMFEAGGMSVHSYTSPHLVRFHERIRVGGALLGDGDLARLLEEVERINGEDRVTFFEVTTAAAFRAFAESSGDVTLLETGLGGRADSTNVVPQPLATIITPIARDHEHFLGNSLTAIAGEKAGIMRKGVACFSARQDGEAEAELMRHAEAVGAPFYIEGRDFFVERSGGGVKVMFDGREVALPKIGLRGGHQCHNAGLAAAAVMASFPKISDETLAEGASGARWAGRIERLKAGRLAALCGQNCPLWLDGAHNAHGAEALAATLPELHDGRWVMICGALNTRDSREFLTPMKAHVAEAFTVTIPEQVEALDGRELSRVAQSLGIDARFEEDIETALTHGAEVAQEMGGAIIITGSLYLAGHVLKLNGTLPD